MKVFYRKFLSAQILQIRNNKRAGLPTRMRENMFGWEEDGLASFPAETHLARKLRKLKRERVVVTKRLEHAGDSKHSPLLWTLACLNKAIGKLQQVGT
jgi:hypothetical protein